MLQLNKRIASYEPLQNRPALSYTCKFHNMKDKSLTSAFLTLNATILKYYACSKASLKPGKCIWGRRSYIMIHCHPLDVCGHFHRTHQRLPSTPSQCSANKIRPPAAKAADFLKAVTDFRVPWGPQVCNVRSF